MPSLLDTFWSRPPQQADALLFVQRLEHEPCVEEGQGLIREGFGLRGRGHEPQAVGQAVGRQGIERRIVVSQVGQFPDGEDAVRLGRRPRGSDRRGLHPPV